MHVHVKHVCVNNIVLKRHIVYFQGIDIHAIWKKAHFIGTFRYGLVVPEKRQNLKIIKKIENYVP